MATKFENRAKQLLDEYNVVYGPVPVDRIAKKLGAKLRYSPLDDEISGMIFFKNGCPIIGVNSLHHPNRQRFTISHEIGHLIFHKNEISDGIHVDKEFPMLMRDSISSAGINGIEIQANSFAAELLMPKKFIEEALGGKGIDIDKDEELNKLAIQFKVSKSAMRFRLGNLLG